MDLPLNTARSLKDWYGAKALSLLLLVSCLLALPSCSLTNRSMTAPDFDRISIGASISEVVDEAGEPFNITSLQNGAQQYRYVERIETGPGLISQNTYVLTVVNGQVVDKQRLDESQSLNIQYR